MSEEKGKMFSVDIPFPEGARDALVDSLIEAASRTVEKLPAGARLVDALDKLRSDSKFHGDLKRAIQKATEEFVAEFGAEYPGGAEVLTSKLQTLRYVDIRNATAVYLTKPDLVSQEEYKVLLDQFAKCFPPETEASVVSNALERYLAFLKASAWRIPEIREVVALGFDKIIAEATREHLEISKSQLEVTNELLNTVKQLAFPNEDKRLLPSSGEAVLKRVDIGGQEQYATTSDGFAREQATLPENLRAALESSSGFLSDDSLNKILDAPKLQVEIFLSQKISEYTRFYKDFGNPILIFEAASSLARRCENKSIGHSYEFGRLLLFLGNLLIDADPDLKAIQQARRYLEKALNIFNNQNLFVQEILTNFLRASWLHAVAIKIEGDFHAAFQLLVDSLEDNYLSKVTNIEITIPLVRQEVIMKQSSGAHQDLLNGTAAYKHNRVEYFHSIRRVFEYSLNTQNFATMEELYKLSAYAYKRARNELPKVYIYTYLKNVYHYLLLNKRDIEAEQLYRQIAQDTLHLNLHGQYRQIVEIKKMFQSGPLADLRLKAAVYSKGQ